MSRLKRLLHWLQQWDGIWTIPLSFALTLFVSSLLLYYWGPTVGIFPPGLMTGGFIAVFFAFVGYTLANFLINYYDRGWFRYYYGKEIREDFKKLPVWLKILFVPVMRLLLFYLFYRLVVHLV